MQEEGGGAHLMFDSVVDVAHSPGNGLGEVGLYLVQQQLLSRVLHLLPILPGLLLLNPDIKPCYQ